MHAASLLAWGEAHIHVGKHMLRLPGGGKVLENCGNAASSGWRQNVLKYVCVKLGYPAAVREAAGSQNPHSSDEAP
jgi:hypothetical protein